MSETLRRVAALVAVGEVEVSSHGVRELADDDIRLDDVLHGVDTAMVVEDYPEAWKGPTVLVLQRDASGRPLHIVWGVAGEMRTPAVLVTAWRPDPDQWSSDFTRRK